MTYATVNHPDPRIADFAAALGFDETDTVRDVEIEMMLDLGATEDDADHAREAWNRSRPNYRANGTYWGYARVVVWGRIADRREAVKDAAAGGAV